MSATKEAVQVSAVKRPLTMEEVKQRSSMFAADRVRKGKTRRDRENGAKGKNAMNKELRGNWRNEGNGKRSLQSFPWATCNGKNNRYQVTGKGGQIVFLRDKK